VEQGLASPSDRDFAGRLTHHRQRIAALTADSVSLERQLASSQRRITPDVIGRFGRLLGERLRGEVQRCARRIRLSVDEIAVEDEQVHIAVPANRWNKQ
jgi:hypothetical protein